MDNMLNLFTFKPESFGLDFSDSFLRIAKLRKKKNGFDVVSYGEYPLRPGIIRNGEVKKEEDLVESIKKTVNSVKGKKLSTNYVVSSLPDGKAFLEVIQMPLIPKEDLKSAVIYEAENYIPLPIQDVYLDSEIVAPIVNHLNHFDVLIAALPRKTVDPYLVCLKKAGLKPLALEMESFAIARALVKNHTSSSPVAIVDLNQTKTSVIIFSGNSLRFSFCIPIAGRDLTEAICRNLKIDEKEAETLKKEHGLENKTKKGKEVFEALIFPLTDLAEQIKKYLDFYSSHASHEHLASPAKKVSKILLSGSGANLKGLADYISENLSIKVELGDPWVNILSEEQRKVLEPSTQKSLSFVSALGLAIRAAKTQK